MVGRAQCDRYVAVHAAGGSCGVSARGELDELRCVKGGADPGGNARRRLQPNVEMLQRRCRR
eukprot:5207664-Pleurochrysis_carterae.AAC.1